MPNEALVDEAIGRSVQTALPDYFGAWYTASDHKGSYELSLPPLDHPYRQAILRRISTHPQSSMWSSSAAGLITQIQAMPWSITGKRRVNYYQDVLLDAEYAEGWDAFIQKLLWDYLNNDDGGFIQVIGRGPADRPLSRELVVGISVLSAEYCFATGNPEYPVWYQDAQTGDLHKLHRSRVIRLVDQPMSDPRLRGRGLCALSRAIGYVQQAMVTMGYVGGSLANMLPPGIAIWNGAQPQVVEDMWRAYRVATDQKLNAGAYRPAAEYINTSGDKTVTLTWTPFAVAPEGFDAKVMETMQAHGIARALQIDVQDVEALSTGQFGTGTQSVILQRKAEGKMLGALLKQLERELNTKVLPDNLRFEFKTRDPDKTIAEAQVTEAHVRVAQMLAAMPGLPADVAARYLAANDDTMADLLLDENGELITAHDDDPDPATVIVTDLDAEPAGEDGLIVDYDDKAFEEVAAPFVGRFLPIIREANSGGLTSRRLDTLIRSVVRQYGQRAMLQGLKDGGVETDELTGADLQAYTRWWGQTSKYITEYVSRTFGYGDGLIERSPAGIENTARMWVNKSLREIYQAGLASADQNGMYQWALGGTEEHCRDCLRFNGQRHRMREWVKAGALPGVSELECHGYNCDCRLIPTRGRARGRIVW